MSTVVGHVKWFDPKKGYGFILGPDNQDVFVHYSQITGEGFRSLKDGEAVEYELVESDKGWQARQVHHTPTTPGSPDTPAPDTPDTSPAHDDMPKKTQDKGD